MVKVKNTGKILNKIKKTEIGMGGGGGGDQEEKIFWGLALCIFKTLEYLFSLCSLPFTHHFIIIRIPLIVCNVDLHLLDIISVVSTT